MIGVKVYPSLSKSSLTVKVMFQASFFLATDLRNSFNSFLSFKCQVHKFHIPRGTLRSVSFSVCLLIIRISSVFFVSPLFLFLFLLLMSVSVLHLSYLYALVGSGFRCVLFWCSLGHFFWILKISNSLIDSPGSLKIFLSLLHCLLFPQDRIRFINVQKIWVKFYLSPQLLDAVVVPHFNNQLCFVVYSSVP